MRAESALPDLSLEALVATPLSHDSKYDRTQRTAAKYEQDQRNAAAAMSVITRDEIKAFGWRTLDQALASLPGIHLTYDREYTYLGTRGFGLPGDYNSRVLLAINGNRVNDGVYDAAMIGREFPLDMDLVERIEFMPGPGGAVYGQNAMFGVINVITRSGAQVDGGELAGAWQHPQSLGEGRVSWGKLLGNGVDVLVSASGLSARGEDLRFDFPGASVDYPWLVSESGLARGMDGERDREFFARAGRGPWQFDFVYGNRRKDNPTGTYLSAPLVPGQSSRDAFLLTQLSYRDRFADGALDVLGRVFLGRERWTGLYQFPAGPTRMAGLSDWHGAELRLVYRGVRDHTLMLGFEVQDNSRVDQTSDKLPTSGVETAVLGSGWRAGVYLQDEWRINEVWSAILGVRVDRNNVTGTDVNPRAALIWQAAPTTTLKALYGRAHRAPNAGESAFADGSSLIANPDLAGESVDTLELVVDHRLQNDFTLRGSLYRWTMRDLITLVDVGGGLSQYQSGETIEATGLELSADKTWDSGTRLRGSVSYQDIAYVGGASLVNAPTWLGKLNFSTLLPWAGLRLGYELQYDAARLTIAGNETGDNWRSHLTLTASQWAKGLEVSLSLRNLFDQAYAHPASSRNWQDALEQDGRSARLKLEYRF
ncbi:MAG: TonB-dependent receptor plug domain-containing protein [Thiobacillus sp.]